MESRSSKENERLLAYRRAAEAMERGDYRPPLPAIEAGPTDDELDRLGSALSRLGTALERRFAEAEALIRLGEKVNAGLVLGEILDQIFESFQPIIPYDRIGCSLLKDKGRTVKAVWTRSLGAPPKLGVGYSAPLAGSSLARIIETGQPRILNDLEQHLREHPQSSSTRLILSDGVRSSLTCPLVAQGKRIGFVFFSSNQPNTYSEHHVALFTLIAGQVSLIVEKGRLYEDLLRAKAELSAANQTLSRVATLDGLTGIPNRRAMDGLLENAWRRAVRNKTPLSLIMVDVDHFKGYNDRFGHVEGDKCLIRVASEIRCVFRRPDDVIARYGGDEFLAVPASAPIGAAVELAERLRILIAEHSMRSPTSEEFAGVSISAGVAGVDSASDCSIGDLIASADRALYAAKADGRNRVVPASLLPALS